MTVAMVMTNVGVIGQRNRKLDHRARVISRRTPIIQLLYSFLKLLLQLTILTDICICRYTFHNPRQNHPQSYTMTDSKNPDRLLYIYKKLEDQKKK